LAKPLSLRKAMQLSPVLRRRGQIVPVLSPWSMMQAGQKCSMKTWELFSAFQIGQIHATACRPARRSAGRIDDVAFVEIC
jgi:hypothetical protein